MSEKNYIVTAGTVRPGFRIGRFTLYDSHSNEPGGVWIEGVGGEGGDFDAGKLEAVAAVKVALGVGGPGNGHGSSSFF